MIALLWSMLVARRGQAAALLLLSVFATGAAVAGPVYLGAVDHATVATEVAESPRTERTVRLAGTVGLATGPAQRHLPIVADHDFALIPPRWPTPVAVLGPWSVVAGTFVTAAVGLGWASRVRD